MAKMVNVKIETNEETGVTAARRFIVIPFIRRSAKGPLQLGEMRPASSSASAERIAEAMSGRFAGVAAYSVAIEKESGTMTEPKLIIQFGETQDLMSAE